MEHCIDSVWTFWTNFVAKGKNCYHKHPQTISLTNIVYLRPRRRCFHLNSSFQICIYTKGALLAVNGARRILHYEKSYYIDVPLFSYSKILCGADVWKFPVCTLCDVVQTRRAWFLGHCSVDHVSRYFLFKSLRANSLPLPIYKKRGCPQLPTIRHPRLTTTIPPPLSNSPAEPHLSDTLIPQPAKSVHSSTFPTKWTKRRFQPCLPAQEIFRAWFSQRLKWDDDTPSLCAWQYCAACWGLACFGRLIVWTDTESARFSSNLV